ncbi:MAG: tetratricopeptide repeat protein [Vampirovibrionales bacterium]|nr:tetratricopeptide repeat protein [Vampirovibrionales bacterium]
MALVLSVAAWASQPMPTTLTRPHDAQSLLTSSFVGPLYQANLVLNGGGTLDDSDDTKKVQAMFFYRRSLELEPANVVALYNLGVLSADLAERSPSITQQAIFIKQAETLLWRLQVTHPDLPGVYFQLGRLMLIKNDLEAAADAYELGFDYLPENGYLAFNLATVLDHQGKSQRALKYYQDAVVLLPKFAAGHNNMGLLLEKMHQTQAAEKAYRAAIAADADYTFARLNLGNLYQQHDDLSKALRTFSEAVEHDPASYWAQLYLGNVAFQSSDYSRAAKAYAMATKLNPQDASAYYLLAVTLHRVNKLNEAQSACLNYISRAPQGTYRTEVIRLLEVIEYQRQLGPVGLLPQD